MIKDVAHTDSWGWGQGRLIWGFAPDHKYTFKILEPKKGRLGCLSLQYHNQKSESWVVFSGIAWAMVVVGDLVCTRLMRPGDIQNLPCGLIHRLMGASDDLQVLEPSTPDAHAADKSAAKDVVRLHCTLGRECSAARNAQEEKIVAEAIRITEEAITCIEAGGLPVEYNAEVLAQFGAWRVPER